MDYDDILTAVRTDVELVLRLDPGEGDPERAHMAQDNATERTLRWIAAHTTDPQARQLAAECMRAIDSPAERWYA